MMKKIKMLDCTLRDGGCVNNFNFGEYYMKQILNGIERSGIEIIELGYIDSKSGTEFGRTQYCDDKVIVKNFLKNKEIGITYVAMIDYGKYNPDLLQDRNENTIDGIRLAFHKKDRKNMLDWAKKIIDKGYQLYIQPMTCLRYSDSEMLDLISDVNELLPGASAFYIVDSFGEMRLEDMNRIANLIDHNLKSEIPMGLHSHNNLQLSYSNAVTLLNYKTKRELIFDCSIMGMGKGAGNMATELFADHLNLYEEKNYAIEPLLEVIDSAINQIRTKYNWGYSVEYYLSAKNHCTPSYASYFYKKHMLTIRQVSDLLGLISEEKKISFDVDYADRLYYEFNSNCNDDSDVINRLTEVFNNNEVLILAPGKSVLKYKDKIEDFLKINDVKTISLNNNSIIKSDFAFVTKESSFNTVKDTDVKIIMTSNVPIDAQNSIVVNYETLTKYEGGISDNSTVMLINLLIRCGVGKIFLAGFDGFSAVIDDNYYDEVIKRPIETEEVQKRNELIASYLNSIKNKLEIVFLTPSKYQ